MNKFVKFILVTVTALIAFPPVLFAQNTDAARERLRNEYDKSQQVIERAENVIAETSQYRQYQIVRVAIDLARTVLNNAKEMQDDARTGLNSDAALVIAASLKRTELARDRAWQSINIIKEARDRLTSQTEENENIVLRQLEKTDRLAAQLQAEMAVDSPRRLAEMFDSARDNQRRAWELYYKRQLRPALRLSLQAEKSLNKLAELLQDDRGANQRMQNQLRLLEQQMEQARQLAAGCPNADAAPVMNRLEETYRNCLRLAAENAPGQFEQNMKQARQMYRHLNELCAAENELQTKLRQMTAELERLREKAGLTADDQVNKLLDAAAEHIRNAERLCHDNRADDCAGHIKAAQMNLRKATELLGK